MRIVLALDHFDDDLAGTENQVARLTRALARNHEVTLLVLRASPWLRQHASQLGCMVKEIPARDFRSLRGYLGAYRVWQFLKETRPDVIHSFFPAANIIGVLAGRMAGVPAVFASRRDYGEWMSPRYLLATRLANQFATAIVANSRRVRDLTVAKEKVDPEKVVIIENGIDTFALRRRKSKEQAKESLGLDPDVPVIGMVANYRPMKRHMTIVSAANILATRGRSYNFLLIGENATSLDLKAQVVAKVSELGLREQFHFHQAKGDITNYLDAMDVGVNCSSGEGLSNAIMEYMAAKVPCIVANSGGNPDLVRDGNSGLLFELDDAGSLAAHIDCLIDSPAQAESLASAAYANLLENMTDEVMLQKFMALYAADYSGHTRVKSRG